MKKTFLLTCAVLLSLGLFGQEQQWANFQPLQAEGPVPSDFTEAYARKFKRESENIDEGASRDDFETRQDFFRKSEFFIDNFLISGDVVFGDSISALCNDILDVLLKDDPELRKELRVYTVKSPSVNALATASGIIFVHAGLMAQVENEAQLAYVLSHEVIHYRENHTVDQYVEAQKVEEEEDLIRWDGSDDETLVDLSQYSKELELEADNAGFNDYYVKSDYDPLQALYVMDVLQYSYLPFDELTYDEDFLAIGAMGFPGELFLTKVADITQDADYDDSESSHPNIKKRKEAILDHFNPQDSGKTNILGKDRFKYCQRLARYEISRIELERRNYLPALVNTFLLEQTYGSDAYIALSKLKTLHGISVYANKLSRDRVVRDYEEIEGESQQLYHLFTEMSDEAINVITVAFAYQYLQDHPESDYARRVFEHSVKELYDYHEISMDDFPRQADLAKADEKDNVLDSLMATRQGRSSKIKTIKEKRESEEAQSVLGEGESYYHYALIDFWSDSSFVAAFEQHEKLSTVRKAIDKLNDESEVDYYFAYSEEDDMTEEIEGAESLGLDKIIMLSPRYLRTDQRSDDNIRYLETESRLEGFRKSLLQLSDQMALDLTLLDYKNLTTIETEQYNDITLLKAWLYERMNHSEAPVVVSSFDYVQELIERYGIEHLATTGNLTARKEEDYYRGCLSMVALWPSIPFVLADWFQPDYYTYHYFYVYDLNTGERMMKSVQEYETSDAGDFLQSTIYGNLLKVKTPPSKSN